MASQQPSPGRPGKPGYGGTGQPAYGTPGQPAYGAPGQPGYGWQDQTQVQYKPGDPGAGQGGNQWNDGQMQLEQQQQQKGQEEEDTASPKIYNDKCNMRLAAMALFLAIIGMLLTIAGEALEKETFRMTRAATGCYAMDSWWVGVVTCLGLGIAAVVVRCACKKYMLATFILGLCGILASISYIIFVAVKWAEMRQGIDAAYTGIDAAYTAIDSLKNHWTNSFGDGGYASNNNHRSRNRLSFP